MASYVGRRMSRFSVSIRDGINFYERESKADYVHPTLLPPVIPFPGQIQRTRDGSVWMFDASTHQFIQVRRIGIDGRMEALDHDTGEWIEDPSDPEDDDFDLTTAIMDMTYEPTADDSESSED